MELSAEERRVAIEVIANLAHVKTNLVELILKPCGMPQEVYQPFLYKHDEITGKKMSKRQIAPLILESTERSGNTACVRKIIEIATTWDKFHLAGDEYLARGTVQKAIDVNQRAIFTAKEALLQIRREQEEVRQHAEKEHVNQMNLLLMMFDDLMQHEDHHHRGYLLQEFLLQLFRVNDIPVEKAFTRNDGGEQIDGAFWLDGWNYLVECRWRDKLADIRQLDGLKGQVDRSGKQTMGVYLSINGWSNNVIPLLKQNPQKCIILMEGYDLRTILSGEAELVDLVRAKVRHLNLKAEPFLSVRDYLASCTKL